MGDEDVVLLNYDQAVALLPDGERIHTFLDGGVALIGADWDREAVLALLRATDRREVTGPGAQAMGHGLAAFRDGEPVFIQARPWGPSGGTEPEPAPCLGGCGCRLGTDDADRFECGCDGGCCGDG